MITNSKGKYLPQKVVTTSEVLESLDGIDKKVADCLVNVGDIIIFPEKRDSLKTGGFINE